MIATLPTPKVVDYATRRTHGGHETRLKLPQAKRRTCTAQPQSQAVRLRVERILAESIDFVPNAHFSEADYADAITDRRETCFAESAPLERQKSPQGMPPYLASLYQTALLSKQDEADLFQRMNFLKFQAARLRNGVDPRDVTPEVLDQIEGLLCEARRIRDELIQSNLRLVVSIAKQFMDIRHGFDDLVSEGNMALLRSVEKFDFGRGFRFSTYATWAIRRSLFQLIMKQRRRRSRDITSADELLEHVEEQNSIWSVSPQAIHTLGRIVEQLEDRERSIIELRFGLSDEGRCHTLREVGSHLGVSKERVRQIELRALEKLRALADNEQLDPPEG